MLKDVVIIYLYQGPSIRMKHSRLGRAVNEHQTAMQLGRLGGGHKNFLCFVL